MFYSFILVLIGCIFAAAIPDVGKAMTLVGSTINPVMGFILPVVFYWNFIKDQPWYGKEKLMAIANVIIIVVASILSLTNFFMSFSKTDD